MDMQELLYPQSVHKIYIDSELYPGLIQMANMMGKTAGAIIRAILAKYYQNPWPITVRNRELTIMNCRANCFVMTSLRQMAKNQGHKYSQFLGAIISCYFCN